jgi:hypothetical protein
MGYTSLLVRGLIRLFVPHGYTTLLFPGGVYPDRSARGRLQRYTTLLFPGGVYPRRWGLRSAKEVYNPVISGWCIPSMRGGRSIQRVYNPVISGWCIPSMRGGRSIQRVYNPVISGWCIPLNYRKRKGEPVYNPVISGWCIPPPHIPELSLTGIQPCYFRVVYTPHRHIQFPESAGRHLSHNKPANRAFLLPRRPCISTGVNSGYTVRTRFYFLGNVCNHCTLYLLAIGL